MVIVSDRLGHILTDIGAAIAGSMGLAPSANLDPERRHSTLFHPVHGSAPDIVGQGIANPIGASSRCSSCSTFWASRPRPRCSCAPWRTC